MTTIIKAADAAEFLALVPRLAGFRPVRSVAIVPFHANRTLGVMRLDLPPDDADIERMAATLVGMVCKIRDADGLAVVVYSDHGFAGLVRRTAGSPTAAWWTRSPHGRMPAGFASPTRSASRWTAGGPIWTGHRRPAPVRSRGRSPRRPAPR